MGNNMANEIQKYTRESFGKIEVAMQQAGFSPEKVKQEISFAIQLINKSAQLQKCSQESILQAVLNVSNIGLSLNPAAKEAYLIPRWNGISKSTEASLDPSYVGLVKLLTDAGSVTSMLCQLVHEGDTFEIDLANNINPVTHKPELNRSKRGEITGCYALATLPDRTRQVEYMDKGEIEDIRGRSETYKAWIDKKISSCTWVSDFGEMARKTVIKRIYKYLPRTERMQFIDKAVTQDNQDFTASDQQLNYIESLLHTCTLDERIKSSIEMELSVMNGQRASQVIEQLKQNQIHDPLKSVQKEARRMINESANT
jgi:recombination protein RecT